MSRQKDAWTQCPMRSSHGDSVLITWQTDLMSVTIPCPQCAKEDQKKEKDEQQEEKPEPEEESFLLGLLKTDAYLRKHGW